MTRHPMPVGTTSLRARMQSAIQILFTIPSDQPQPFNRLLAIGGFHCHQIWTLSQTDAINAIGRNQLQFWVSVDGQRVPVVVDAIDGHRYLKTGYDADQPESLLRLAEARQYYQADGV